jgi:hypothetical protein
MCKVAPCEFAVTPVSTAAGPKSRRRPVELVQWFRWFKICLSRVNRVVCLFWLILIIVYIAVVMIISMIIKTWSLKKD